ncbi:hypothetical protein [Carboxylicivirga marina]|uniref:hypothetical protein n=1 Tax=Carboxylicivirga marina TaxID=2800988 RepID=UPI00259A62D0|nr:hypothetical protein [uncultured Carboxylicivirga sp.]
MKMHKNMYKFKIEEKLNELEYSSRDEALKELMKLTKVSRIQFYRWRRILLTDSADIPTSKIAIIAKYFGCSIEELIHPDALSKNIIAQTRSENDLGSKYGMTCS